MRQSNLSLRRTIVLWILVRLFLSATQLLDKLKGINWETEPEHVQLLRGVVASLYQQIRRMDRMYFESPTARRLTENQWP